MHLHTQTFFIITIEKRIITCKSPVEFSLRDAEEFYRFEKAVDQVMVKLFRDLFSFLFRFFRKRDCEVVHHNFFPVAPKMINDKMKKVAYAIEYPKRQQGKKK